MTKEQAKQELEIEQSKQEVYWKQLQAHDEQIKPIRAQWSIHYNRTLELEAFLKFCEKEGAVS